MTRIEIIFTGLIALVPSQTEHELIALLAAAQDHEAAIVVDNGREIKIAGKDLRLFDGDQPAIPTSSQIRIPKEAIEMNRLSNPSGQAYGPVNRDLIAKLLQNRRIVASRVRVTADTVHHNFHYDRQPPPKWTFKREGIPGLEDLELADNIVVRVRLEQPNLRLFDKNANLVGSPIPISKKATISNDTDEINYCDNICADGQLSHFRHLFGLSATSAPNLDKRWTPTTTADLCYGCLASSEIQLKQFLALLGNKPVRCPSTQFNPASLQTWE